MTLYILARAGVGIAHITERESSILKPRRKTTWDEYDLVPDGASPTATVSQKQYIGGLLVRGTVNPVIIDGTPISTLQVPMLAWYSSGITANNRHREPSLQKPAHSGWWLVGTRRYSTQPECILHTWRTAKEDNRYLRSLLSRNYIDHN